MRMNERIQFKLRNFLYEQERKRTSKGSMYKANQTDTAQTLGAKASFKESIEEIDTYLDEKFKDIKVSKMKK